MPALQIRSDYPIKFDAGDTLIAGKLQVANLTGARGVLCRAEVQARYA
jgi:hypothetical protein